MARKFVRNITGTNLREENGNVEPLDTNLQNDLLNDDEDVFVRNKKEYHALTDNLKTKEFKTGQFLSQSNISKNGTTVSGKKATQGQAEEGEDIDGIMNPLRVKQAIDKQVPPMIDPVEKKIDDHIKDDKNPHKVNKQQVGLSNVLNIHPNQLSESQVPVNNPPSDGVINLNLGSNNTTANLITTVWGDNIEDANTISINGFSFPENSCVIVTLQKKSKQVIFDMPPSHIIVGGTPEIIDNEGRMFLRVTTTKTNRLIEVLVP